MPVTVVLSTSPTGRLESGCFQGRPQGTRTGSENAAGESTLSDNGSSTVALQGTGAGVFATVRGGLAVATSGLLRIHYFLASSVPPEGRTPVGERDRPSGIN